MMLNNGCLIVKIHHSKLCWLCQDNLALGKQLLPQYAADHIEDGCGGIMVKGGLMDVSVTHVRG